MANVCKICTATTLGKVSRTVEEHARHLESEHHIPVRRENETEAQCVERFLLEQPEAGGPMCQCPTCTLLSHSTVCMPQAIRGLG